jgi:hypothetical protein
MDHLPLLLLEECAFRPGAKSEGCQLQGDQRGEMVHLEERKLYRGLRRGRLVALNGHCQ